MCENISLPCHRAEFLVMSDERDVHLLR
jgi:hypothetical protein